MTTLRRTIRRYWNDFRSVYYANTPFWRVLKSGALLFFGFFCWSGASVLRSYRPDWEVLTYVMAYGFVLILWGPLTHLVVVPLIVRYRRAGRSSLARAVSRYGTKVNLSVFFAIVLVLGTAPIAPMLLDFDSALTSSSTTPDVDPDLDCETTDELVACTLSDPSGIDHVVVTSGDRQLLVVEEQPFVFEVERDRLVSAVGGTHLLVELRDGDGRTLRRYTRTIR